MQDIVLYVGDHQSDANGRRDLSRTTGKLIAKELHWPLAGNFKDKLTRLRKMQVFDAGHGYPLSEKGQQIYCALKDAKDRTKSP
jgi:hypothetical protein